MTNYLNRTFFVNNSSTAANKKINANFLTKEEFEEKIKIKIYKTEIVEKGILIS